MPGERLDVIVLGANPEGLFTAAAIATKGKFVAVIEERAAAFRALNSKHTMVDRAAAQSLELDGLGLRYRPPPPLIGVSQDQTLVLWPEVESTQASISALSVRDADAWGEFVVKMNREAHEANGRAIGVSDWHWAAGMRSEVSATAVRLHAASLRRILDEEFASPLLKGILAQAALSGTGASVDSPGSAALLMREAMLAQYGYEQPARFVSGGSDKLVEALLAKLKFLNNADVYFGARIRELRPDRDGGYSVELDDGTVHSAVQVISCMSQQEVAAFARGEIPFKEARDVSLQPGIVRFAVQTAPALKGVALPLVASGARIFLNPSCDKLSRARGAYQAGELIQDFCVEIGVSSVEGDSSTPMWNCLASVMYLPSATKEGPWTGVRRERLTAAISHAIGAWAPGFEASVKDMQLLHPTEPRLLLEEGRAVPVERQMRRDPMTVPAQPEARFEKVSKNLWFLSAGLMDATGSAAAEIARTHDGPARGVRAE